MLIGISLLTACSFSDDKDITYKETKIISRISKGYDKYQGYECRANIKINSDDMETNYLIDEKYDKPGSYKMEILKPKESQGIIILNTNDKIFVEHPSINQHISLLSIKSLNKQLIIGEFFENLDNIDKFELETIDEIEYYVFTFELTEKNKYREFAKVWVTKKNHIPFRMQIMDENNSQQIEITYEKFKFIK